MAGTDIPALRASLAAFIKDPRTIKAFEELGNTAVGAQGAADDAITLATAAQATADMALALIELLADSAFVTLSANSSLDNERVLTAGNLIGLTDSGSGGNVTVRVTSSTVGGNFVTLTNPSAITFPRINADNSVSTLDAAAFRTAIGTGSGTVSSVAASGGTTGLSFTGGPITTTGTLTLGGVLDEVNGGTGFSSYIAGDLIYAASASVLARLGVGVTNYVLTSNGSAPGWTANTGTGNVVRASLPQFTSTIGVGGAASVSGSGISFPATQSDSTDPNTLDDYEEGTWTPTVVPNTGAGFTYTSSGRYTKVGNKVTASFTVAVTANGTGAGYLRVSLPPAFGTPIFFSSGFGSEYGTTGIALITTAGIGTSVFNVQTTTGGYPVVTGSALTCTVIYFV